jgi:hypothetical protein
MEEQKEVEAGQEQVVPMIEPALFSGVVKIIAVEDEIVDVRIEPAGALTLGKVLNALELAKSHVLDKTYR